MRIIAFLLILCTLNLSAQENYKSSMLLMGCNFDISVVTDSKLNADRYIYMAVEEIQRIENLISSWNENSETSKINKYAGIQPVAVSEELFLLVERCIAISKLTNGAFDISYASIDKIWKFDGSMKTMPSKNKIANSVKHIGYQNIKLNTAKQTIYLNSKEMKIGFGAIGKGYAADRAKELLQARGVSAGIINASGDLNAWGKQANGKPWLVAITNPINKKKAFSWMPIYNSSVVTSGNYEKYIEFNNIKYSHIIDPRTGYPSSGIQSVTVFTQKAEFADALATSLFVMGVDTGIHFINQLKDVECIFVDSQNKIHSSKNISFDDISSKN